MRSESSKILGYSNYAERSLASKMAPSVEAVRELADLIAEKALPAARLELEQIKTYARDNDPELEDLQPWDIPFWSERYRE